MVEILKEADAIVITAGAGMGVDSGLPDFRGNEGMWKAYPSLGERKISFSTIANPHAFQTNPELAWAFYGHRYDLYKNTKPHAGFGALLEMVKDKPYFVVTSNVDGHFQKAGFDADKVYEIHGRINKFQCTECQRTPWEIPSDTKFDVDPATLKFKGELPRCECGAVLRPNIMMFGDFGFNSSETSKQEVAFNKFMHMFDKGDKKIAVLEFGAGTAIPSIRQIGEFIHEQVEGATLVRINPRESQGPYGTVSIAKGALEAIAEDLVSDEVKEMFFMN